MSDGTAIEWTHRPGTIPATMNALVGCRKVSAGCANCYAIEVAHVRAGNPLPVMQEKFAGTTRSEGGRRVWTGKVTLSEKALLAPLTAKKPRTYFVNSMSDLFYDGVPNEWIDRHFAVFAQCPQHTFIVLTKRPERMRAYVRNRLTELWQGGEPDRDAWSLVLPLPNVWLGVSAENQEQADKRIPELLTTPAAVRLVSYEPALGPVDFTKLCYRAHPRGLGSSWINALAGSDRIVGIDWVICGGESGPGARPMHPDWARSVRDQCVAAGVPFFFKQWGEWAPNYGSPASGDWVGIGGKLRGDDLVRGDAPVKRVGKKLAGHLLDGEEWHQFPDAGARNG